MNEQLAGVRATDRTRDCIDPWKMALVKVDGSVSLCCWGDSVGTLGTESFPSIVNGARAREFRERLLSGSLGDDCLRCPARSWSTPSRLRERLQEFLQRERERRALVAHAAELEGELVRWKAHARALQARSDAQQESATALREHAAALERERDHYSRLLTSGLTGWWRRATAPWKRALRRLAALGR